MPVWLSFTTGKVVTALKVPFLSAASTIRCRRILLWSGKFKFISTAVDPPMPIIGPRVLDRHLDATRFLGSAMAGLLNIIALYQLSIFFRRRDQQESLWFISSVGLAVRQVVTTRLPGSLSMPPQPLASSGATDLSTPP